MSVNENYRRRSLSASDTSSVLKIDSNASSIWSSNKSKGSTFLSRLISTTNTTPVPAPTVVSPTSSASSYISSTLPQINGQQRIKRKPINSSSNTMSGFTIDTPLTSPTETIPAAAMPAMARKKYELVLGVTDKELTKDSPKKDIPDNTNQTNVGQNTVRGFGNIFKRNGSKSIEKKDNDLPIHNQKRLDNSTVPATKSTAETESFEPLPPLEFPSSRHQELGLDFRQTESSQSNEDNSSGQISNTQKSRYEIGERQSSAYSQESAKATQAPNASRWSNASTRKSTGSYSIYSTFGSDSVFGDDGSSDSVVLTASTSIADLNEKEQQANKENETIPNADLIHIIEANMSTRSPAKLVVIESSEEDDDENYDEDEDEDSSDNQADIFVDATGVSQEDIERERTEARLSKRLSGGHYGSAGGLMMSMMMPDGMSKDNKKQRRRSRPPPEDVAQSMINWKRHSGQGQLKLTKPPEQIHQQANEQQPNTLAVSFNTPLAVPEKDLSYQLPPQRPLPQGPLPPKPQPSAIIDNAPEVKEDTKKSEPTSQEVDMNDPQECAARLWYEDSSFVESERIAEWLGQSKPLNTSTLHEYMKYFEFATMRLDSAFRKVCSKLYFRAEAQQIDRILEAFAKRYWECNPKTIFGSADVVYAVVYSLLLLNTDLHVAQGNHTKMTRQAFVKNTMATIREQFQSVLKESPKSQSYVLAWEAHIEAYLKDMYVSVKNYQILQPTQHQNQHDTQNINSDNSSLLSASSGSKRMSMIGGKRMIDIKRSLNTMMYKNSNVRDSLHIQEEPVPRKSTSSTTHQQYVTSTRTAQSYRRRESIISTGSLNNSSGIIIPKASSSASTHSGLLSPNSSHMMSFMDSHSDALFNNHPPYLKEGVVMRKHLLESPNQKAKHREWKECLLIVTQGQLKMYGMQSDGGSDSTFSGKYNMLRSGSSSFANLTETLSRTTTNTSQSYGGPSQQDENSGWAAYSQLMETIDLSHSLANALPPPGYNRSRPHVFAIQQSNGGVYLIQSTSNEQIQEWVSTCNYWAARQSKEPLQGGVGNIEYGWGSCLDDVVLDLDAIEKGKKIIGKYTENPDSVNVSVWTPAAPTMIPSVLDEEAQLEALQKYVDLLNEEINDHREIKKKIQVKFHNKCQNHSRAMANWEAKSKYMLHEIIKYQNYCNSLEDSVARRKKEQAQNEYGSNNC